MIAAMRTTRPTADIGKARHFYEHSVGLPVLWSFVDHDGFDGIILGVPDERAQLELVRAPHEVIPTPTHEDALVLYCDLAARTQIIDRLRMANSPEVPNDDPRLNPYWPRNGATTFVDPDGYRLIISGVD